MPPSNNNNILLPELRVKDYERYLLCLFAAPIQRADFTALYLFNAELAHIRDQVTEPLLGHIRLQWWHDALAQLGTPEQPPHPLLTRMAAWRLRGIDLAPLQQLLSARKTDLMDAPFPTQAAYAAYHTDTSAPFASIGAALLGQQHHAVLFQRATGLYAAAGLLRAIPHWLQRRQMPLPPELLVQHGIEARSLSELQSSPAFEQWARQAAQNIITQCHALRHEARQWPHHERRKAAPLLLHNTLAAYHAGRIVRQGSKLLAPALVRPGSLRLPLLFWRAAIGSH